MNETKKPTGYPSIDKPWLNFYPEEEISQIPMPEGSMYAYLLDNNKDALDDLALIYFGTKVSYRKMFENIDSAAAAFSSLGVAKGDIVAVMLPNIPENIYAIYGLNKIGAIADMIDLRSKNDTLKHYLNTTKAKVAVVCDLFADNVFEIEQDTFLEKIIVVSVFETMPQPVRTILGWKLGRNSIPSNAMKWKGFIKQGKSVNVTDSGTADDSACIFHTSGTTGFPKGVVTTNLNANVMALHGKIVPLRFERGKRIMNQVPPFLAFNILCSMHLPLALHMQMVLLPEYRPDKFAKNIIKTKATCCLAGPADWGNFLEDSKELTKSQNLSMLINPVCGSDALPTEKRKAINKVLQSHGCETEIFEGYGMTEIGSAACCNMPGHVVDGSVGIPFCFNSFCIYDNEAEQELKYGQIGEICMTGPTVMKEYYNEPEETAKVLRRHKDGVIWLHSGDIGYIDESGNIFLEGRLKRIIVRHDGIKVSPFSIEKIILDQTQVSACCVVGANDKEHGRGQVPVAFVAIDNDEQIELDPIRHICESELAENYWPKEYRAIAQLPLTANGKVDYRTLENIANNEITKG
ncbi:MAG: acyl--CoA ligase [Clostridiales bacterium]|nr:acyl--CoA ligase [Clostridiales bacterium]